MIMGIAMRRPPQTPRIRTINNVLQMGICSSDGD
jgi:hypothetical protein